MQEAVSFGYARRRTHRALPGINPYKFRFSLDKEGVYIPDTGYLEFNTIEMYLFFKYGQDVYLSYLDSRFCTRVGKRLSDQLDNTLSWDLTKEGFSFWCNIYNELCDLEGHPEYKRYA